MKAPTLILLLGGSVLWTLLVFHLPWTVGWRDSGEFLLSPVFLDIPHPAGFPLYSMVSNAFTFVPGGHVAWRVHAFAGACALFLLYQTYRLAEDLCPDIGGRGLLRLFAPVMLLLSEPWIRCATTAEVYGLHALLLVGIIRLLVRFSRSSDARWLYLSAALGGLALGNHVASVLAGAWIGVSLVTTRKTSLIQLVVCIPILISTSLVYSYLPARALRNPPLNTGNPVTVTNFLRQVTDERDRALRGSSGAPEAQKPGMVARALKDFTRLSGTMGLAPALLGAASLIILVWKHPFVGSSCLGVFATTLLFFSGWDPDPWVPAMAMLSVGGALGLSYLSRAFSTSRAALWVPTVIGLGFTGLLGRETPRYYDYLHAQHNFTIPSEVGEQLLGSVPRHGLLVTEPTWFVARYLRVLEGYRRDVTLLYLPSLLFPSYFNPPVIESSIGDIHIGAGPNAAEPHYSNVARTLEVGVKNGPVTVEATAALTEPFENILIFDHTGKTLVIDQRNGEIHTDFAGSRGKFLSSLRERAQTLPRALRNDTMNYIEVLLAHETAALSALGRAEDACRLVTLSCPARAGCGERLETYGRAICEAGSKTR